jgi:hypothetical protein
MMQRGVPRLLLYKNPPIIVRHVFSRTSSPVFIGKTPCANHKIGCLGLFFPAKKSTHVPLAAAGESHGSGVPGSPLTSIREFVVDSQKPSGQNHVMHVQGFGLIKTVLQSFSWHDIGS